MQAKRDQNHRTTLIGVSSEDGITPVPFRVDAVTGRLLIQIADQSATSGIVPRLIAKRDPNHIPVALAKNSNGDTQCLVSHEGYLLVDFD